MSEQEMQFADAEWRAPTVEAPRPERFQPDNFLSEEQERVSRLPLLEGEKLSVYRERRVKRRTFSLGLLIAGVGVAGGLGWLLTHPAARKVSATLSPATHPAGQAPVQSQLNAPFAGKQRKIIVNDIYSDVVVNGTSNDEVVIQTLNHMSQSDPLGLNVVNYQFSPDGHTMTINVYASESGDPAKNFVLHVQVPADATLEVHTAQQIFVKGMSGQMFVSTSGLSAGIYVYSNLSGNSDIRGAGSIFFYGALDPHGTYNFLSANGPITPLFLPTRRFN